MLSAMSRRALIGSATGLATVRLARADAPFLFGLTPVFLTSDLVLLEALQAYLARAIGSEVRLVLRV
jgi:phosphonate transport system substrate-binding protein